MQICVPIETSCGLWYLMVASIADKQLFHIAPYFEKQDVYPRQQTIEKMVFLHFPYYIIILKHVLCLTLYCK
jgi:hypothetical protein